MRLLIYIIVTTTCIGAVLGQRYMDTNDPKDDQVKSLLSKDNDLNAFGALDLKVSDFINERAMLVGAYGGFVINRRYLLGIAGYGIVTRVPFEGIVPGQQGTKQLDLHGGYGGILVGATIAPKELIHISIPIVLGVGSMEVVDKDFFANNPADSEFTIEKSVYFVIEPGAQVEFNITRYFRLGAGITYRHVSGTDLENVQDGDIAGVTGLISFRFGRF